MNFGVVLTASPEGTRSDCQSGQAHAVPTAVAWHVGEKSAAVNEAHNFGGHLFLLIVAERKAKCLAS